MRRQWGVAIILTIALAMFAPGLLSAQEDGARLHVVDVDASDFPTIIFRLEAIDGENNRIDDLQGLALAEDGQPIGEFEARPLDVGVDLYFIIDANSTIEDRDEADGATRREKVRDSIIRYAERFMDPTQLDRVTVIVPDGAGGRFLDRPSMTFPNEVINAVNFYQPEPLDEVSLNRLLFMALDEAARSAEEGRFQAIVLFSDAANLADYPDMPSFLTRAQEQGVAVFPVILGSRADLDEIEQAMSLAEPTGGAYAHMPQPVDTDDLYDRIQRRGTLAEISYRSELAASGPHVISAELAGGRGEAEVVINVEPPRVRMAVDNSRPILRVTNDSETALELIEPTQQPLVAQVEWPDGHPRTLVAASLLIDGVEQPLDGSVLGADGILTFDWDISALADGVYGVQVQVVDELGLAGASPPLPLTIEVQRPVAAEAPVATEAAAPTAAPTNVPEVDEGQSSDLLVFSGVGVALIAALLVIVVVIVLLWRSRRQAPVAEAAEAPSAWAQAAPPEAYQPSSPVPSLVAQPDPEVTRVEMPEFAAASDAGAYLEVLENAPEHPGFIPISGNNVTLGRDARRVTILFKDRSVSRLHARILKSHGTYRIYDEGSASGTYVNFERVSLAPRPLADKDQIHFGRVYLRFHLASSERPLEQPDSEEGEENTQIYGLD